MFAPANTAQFELLIPSIRNDFKVLAFKGAEAISSLYAIQIELVSESPDFDLESLLSQTAFLRFGLFGEGLHGLIEDVWVSDAGKRLTRYHLTLVPALHYLQFSHQQRIFQQLAVTQIITQVLEGHGIQADAFTFNVSPSPKREYCTQYGESDFIFVQRLCSEEGMAWHHQHNAQGHHLVFTDDQAWFPTLGDTPYWPGSGQVADHLVVSHFSRRVSTRTSQVTRVPYARRYTVLARFRSGGRSFGGQPFLPARQHTDQSGHPSRLRLPTAKSVAGRPVQRRVHASAGGLSFAAADQ
ncbi:type VI secretion system VgrG family protein [Pseudomonas sp. 3296]|nr:type VI secretion system VgrG family protein [Pseudomonas sp. 3296]